MSSVLADRYVLQRELARGAVGVVWRGLDQVTGEAVAVKVLRDELRAEHDIFESFFAEAEILNAIDHPGVVGVRDFIVSGAVVALVLEFVEGPDLREHLHRNGPLSAAEAARRCASAAETLAAVHRAGFLHGDVKPGNLMLWGADGVKFIDFGIARDAASDAIPSHGTPEYTAPEVAAGESACPGIDNYALGLVLYEALTGHSPYRGGSITDVLERHLTEIPVKPAAVNAELWRIVETLLALDPASRGDLDAIAAELRRLAPRLPQRPTAPVEPQLRERDATQTFAYQPVTPAAPELDLAAIEASLEAESDAAEGAPERPRRRGLLLAGAGLLGLAALGAVAVLAFSGPEPAKEADVADPSESVASSAPAETEPGPEPTEPAEEHASEPAEATSAPQGPVAQTDGPAIDSDDLSDSEDDNADSTEGTDMMTAPGSDLIGSPMPGNG